MSQVSDYSEVSAIQRCPLFRGVRYSEVSAIQRCPLFRGARYSEVPAIQRCPLFRGARYSEVLAIQRCPQDFALILAVPRKCVRYSEVPAISISAIGSFYCIHLWSFHWTADFCCWKHLHMFEVFSYVYLFRITHDIKSLFAMLNNLSYLHHCWNIWREPTFHDDNNNELLDAIIFFRIQFKVKVFICIFHNLETSSKK